MRPGLTISCIAHGVALGLGLVAISAQPMESPPVNSLPVQFISDKDFTQLTQGVKNAPKLKVDDPKPLADKVDAPKPVDQTRRQGRQAGNQDRDGRSPSRKPDPKPADKPAKPKPPDYKPDQIAQLLKKDANKQPPKPDDKPTPEKPRRTLRNSTPIRSRPCSTIASRSARSRRPTRSIQRPISARRPARPRNCRRARSTRCARAYRAAGVRRPASMRSRSSISCSTFCSNRTRSWRVSRPWSKARPRRSVRRWPRAPGARCLLCQPFTHAQARALRPVERSPAQIRSARTARRLIRQIQSS